LRNLAQELGALTQVALRPHTTLRAGGRAEYFLEADSTDLLAEVAAKAQGLGVPVTPLGAGSNVLPSDDGVAGLVLVNRARNLVVEQDQILVDTGIAFQNLFLRSVHLGFRGLEYAVGIPGSLGGALVSNAGAYRSSVSEFLTGLEIVVGGRRQWVEPAWMQFSYRDSILRGPTPPQCVVLRVRMRLPKGDAKASYDEAREYQRQRISKQPAPASAGSFFKNVNDETLAQSLDTLPIGLKQAGVVPAGYLLEAAGLKGHRLGGARFSDRHANFMLNVGGATATDIRRLAELAKGRVRDQLGVALEEEVLYLGDWSTFAIS